MRTPSKDAFDSAIMAVERQIMEREKSLAERASIEPGEACEWAYPLAKRAEHDLWDRNEIEYLREMQQWLDEYRMRQSAREWKSAAKRAQKSELDRILGARARATVDAIAGNGQCDCGATLAHVEGAGVSGVLCPACDAEHLHELTSEAQ